MTLILSFAFVICLSAWTQIEATDDEPAIEDVQAEEIEVQPDLRLSSESFPHPR